jgi:L-fuconolactonase
MTEWGEPMSKPPYEFRGNAYRSLIELAPWIAARQEPILEPGLPIIDPHHHVWDGERGRYLVHELAADVNTGHNIVATVFV